MNKCIYAAVIHGTLPIFSQMYLPNMLISFIYLSHQYSISTTHPSDLSCISAMCTSLECRSSALAACVISLVARIRHGRCGAIVALACPPHSAMLRSPCSLPRICPYTFRLPLIGSCSAAQGIRTQNLMYDMGCHSETVCISPDRIPFLASHSRTSHSSEIVPQFDFSIARLVLLWCHSAREEIVYRDCSTSVLFPRFSKLVAVSARRGLSCIE